MSEHGQIPRRIIQMGPSGELPSVAKACAVNLKLLHPGWDYVFFDDEGISRFVAEKFPAYQTIYKSFSHRIQQLDFFRYLAVYELGGFYLDLDVLLWKQLDELQERGCVFPFEELTINSHLRRQLGIDWEIGNYAFGATAEHPFLAKVISNCGHYAEDSRSARAMIRGVPFLLRNEFEVLNTTGPGLLTRTLVENPALARDVTVIGADNVLEELRWHQFGSYGTHLMIGSWRTRGNPISRRIKLARENWARHRGMVASRRLGPTRAFAAPA